MFPALYSQQHTGSAAARFRPSCALDMDSRIPMGSQVSDAEALGIVSEAAVHQTWEAGSP